MITEELILDGTLAELGRRHTAAAREAAAQRVLSVASARRGTQGGHAVGVWCWLLDRRPARARGHAAV